MPPKISRHDEYKIKLGEKYPGSFTLLTEYTVGREDIHVRCNTCGYTSYRNPIKLLCRGGCKECGIKKRTKTHEQYQLTIKIKHKESFTLLSRYISSAEKIKVKHNQCGAEFWVNAGQLLQHGGCSSCQADRVSAIFSKSHDDFIEQVREKHGEKYTIIGKYLNANTKIQTRHNVCGHEWKTRAAGLVTGNLKACPNCWTDHLKVDDPEIKQMAKNIRSRIIHVLRGRLKSKPTLQLVGVKTREELALKIEEKFKAGMGWHNYGSAWHVDHKRPVSSFDLSDPEAQQKCFHHTNMQPLWREENMIKSSWYNGKKYRGGKAVG